MDLIPRGLEAISRTGMELSPRRRCGVKATFCVLAAIALTSFAAVGQAPRAPSSAPLPPPPGATIIWLWPGEAGDSAADSATLTVFLPPANPTRTAVLVAPGGGYNHLATQKEGYDVARWLNERGVAAFVLQYRLSPPYRYPAAFQDTQRAIRTVRAHAPSYGIADDRIGMFGFSAGGHLTASAGTQFDAGNASAADPVERMSSRPDFLILAYALVTMEPAYGSKGTLLSLLGPDPDPALMEKASAELHVTERTPPAFLFATTDDPAVPVMNSIMFYSALVKMKVPAEIHLYAHGPHGVGLASGFPDLKGWPSLLAAWMTANGWMAATGEAANAK
jgi:acetyl esterase/lipase